MTTGAGIPNAATGTDHSFAEIDLLQVPLKYIGRLGGRCGGIGRRARLKILLLGFSGGVTTFQHNHENHCHYWLK